MLIGVGVLLLAALGVMGYLWYATEKSPSIMGGGYDREMNEKKDSVPAVSETLSSPVTQTSSTISMNNDLPEELNSSSQEVNPSDNTNQKSEDLVLIQVALRQGIGELDSNDPVRIRQYLTIIIAPEGKEKLDQASDGELLDLVSDFRDQLKDMNRLMSHSDSEVEVTDVGGGIVAITAFLEANGGSEQMGVPFRKIEEVWYPYLGPQ